MKALTVCQGWASLMFVPTPKDVENRTWETRYRGDLLIHAGKSRKELQSASQMCRSLGLDMPESMPMGALIGIIEIVDCTQDSNSPWAQPGQFHWVLKNPRLFEQPIECNGALGLWQPTIEIMERVKAAGLVLPHRPVPGRDGRLLQPRLGKEVTSSPVQLSLLD